jgi:hypothetical protein
VEREGGEAEQECRTVLVGSAATADQVKQLSGLHQRQQEEFPHRTPISTKIHYEKLNLSLFQIIKNRRHFKKYFNENEIWYLLYVLIKVAAYFE